MTETAEIVEKSNKYSSQLSEDNYFRDKPLEWFLTNDTERLLELISNSNNDVNDNKINKDLEKFVAVIANLPYMGKYNSINSATRLVLYGAGSGRAKYRFTSGNLPFCCGVAEWGEFTFPDEVDPLLYTLTIDLIRLKSWFLPSTHGSWSIINYFSNTPFMEVLEKREDLTFIKEFTNPKTSAKLKTFIFDNKIK